jgi:hypothetical protein
LLPNGKSFVYPWAKNSKFGPTAHAYSYFIKGMIAVVHTHAGDTRVSGKDGDLAYQQLTMCLVTPLTLIMFTGELL